MYSDFLRMTNRVILYLSKDQASTFQKKQKQRREGVVGNKWCLLGKEWTSVGYWVKGGNTNRDRCLLEGTRKSKD